MKTMTRGQRLKVSLSGRHCQALIDAPIRPRQERGITLAMIRATHRNPLEILSRGRLGMVSAPGFWTNSATVAFSPGPRDVTVHRDLRESLSMRYSSRRVVAAWIPWVAPEDAVGPFEDSPHHSIFFYGFDGVLAAGGVEAAIGAKPWTDGSLVKPNCQDCESTEHTVLFVSSFDVRSFISSGYRSGRGMIGRL